MFGDVLQEQGVVCGVRGIRSGIPRRMHAGDSSKRVHLKPRIIGKQVPIGEAAIVFRLTDGVLFKRCANFFGGRHGPRQLPKLKIRRSELKLAKLPGIRRRAINDHATSKLF